MAREVHSVTVEGTTMPAAGVLATGEQATWAYTEYVQTLITNGFIKVVEYHSDEAPDEEVSVLSTDGTQTPVSDLVPPKGNQSRDDWAEWLAEHTPIVTEGKDRSELIAEYESWIEDQTAGDDGA